MPVSSTRKCRFLMPSPSDSPGFEPTLTITWPLSVNFTALPIKFVTIWRIRPTSPMNMAGKSGLMRTASSKSFSATRDDTNVATSSMASFILKGAGSSFNWPASIFEKSRISLMMVNNEVPDFTMISIKVFCLLSSDVRASNSAIPNTPFIGVRISWLIFARNSDLARSAASESDKACSN